MSKSGAESKSHGLSCNGAVCTFFVLFCLVYYLESISGTYIISVVQSIEKQFRIPSKMSGTLISAQDVGYVPTVVLLSYLGSRGNRARWIGGGCMLIAFANVVISTPNFLFGEQTTVINETSIERIMHAPDSLLQPEANVSQLLQYAYLRKQIGSATYGNATALLDMPSALSVIRDRHNFTANSLDAQLRPLLLAGADEGQIVQLIQKRLATGLSAAERQYIMTTAAGPIGFCDASINHMKMLISDAKKSQEQSNMIAFGIVFGALICLGVGHSMPWSLGVPLIDDNVKRQSLPTYFALMFFIKILGPISGFFVGGTCNRLYYTLEDAGGLQPSDPRWIGAWWLGFLIIAAILIGPSTALFCFPSSASRNVEQFGKTSDEEGDPEESASAVVGSRSRTPKTQKSGGGGLNLVDRHKQVRDTHEALVGHDGSLASRAAKEFKTFGAAIGTVLACPVYLFSLCGRIFDAFAFKGFYAFVPKYLDNHYGIPQYKANYLLGTFGVFGFAAGMLCGSVLMRKLKLEGRRAAAFICVCTLISASFSVGKVFLGCQSVVNSVGKLGLENGFNFSTTCNADCGCDAVKLLPVCDEEHNVYYSPCHAGCQQMLDGTDDKEFYDCSCAVGPSGRVSRSQCRDDCQPMIYAYFVVAAISSLVGGLSVVPGVLMVLRSVPPEWRSISIGFSGFIVSIGTMLSPPLFGYVIDTTCLHWSGSCLIYEPTQLRNRMHIMYGALRAVGCVFDVVVFYYAKDLRIMQDDPVEEADAAEDDDDGDSQQQLKLMSERQLVRSSEDLGPHPPL